MLILWSAAALFGGAAVLMSTLDPLYSLGVLLVVTALAVLGISQLRYLRRSYGSPSLQPLGVSTTSQETPESPSYTYGAASGDGGAQAVNLFASDGYVRISDEAAEEAHLLAAKQQQLKQQLKVSGRGA